MGGFHRQTTAMDGEEALLLFQRQRFDLAVSDLELPRKTDLELADAIRKGTVSPAVPMILLTSRADAGFVMEARRLGLSAYLLKPAAPAQLIAVVERVLGPAARRLAS